MVNYIKIIVHHEKGEIIQLVDNEGIHNFSHIDAIKEISVYKKPFINSQEKIRIQQFHPLNSNFWWRSMLLPICFLQNYLLKYEYSYVDDYFAQLELLVVKTPSANGDVTVNIELQKIYEKKLVEKSFYFSIRKDSYLIPKVRPYYYRFSLKDTEECKVKSFHRDLPVTRRYLSRWKTVRLFPAIITYGAFIVFDLYEILQYKRINYSIPLVFLIVIAVGLLFDITIDISKRSGRTR